MNSTTTAHIWLDATGVAWIDDTNIKVVEVVTDRYEGGWSPEEIHFQYPHLSLAQIHAALAYYFNHQADLDADIERRVRMADEMSSQAGESPFRKRMRLLGNQP